MIMMYNTMKEMPQVGAVQDGDYVYLTDVIHE
jgi:hypothetical protein